MGVMVATADDYSEVLHGFRPVGPAVAGEDALLQGLAPEFARMHNRLGDLLRESDPRETDELLIDWERAFGLPDECCSVDADIDTRIALLVARVRGAGTPTAQYFIDLAALFGFEITVTELQPYTVRSPVSFPLYPAAIRFVWRVTSPNTFTQRFTVKSTVGSPLARWGNPILECLINRAKPAHTYVQFIYSDSGLVDLVRETVDGDVRVTTTGESRLTV